MIKTCIIPCAGLGTRLKPYTNHICKEMQQVAGKPLIQYALDECKRLNVGHIIFVVSRSKGDLLTYIDDNWKGEYTVVFQEKPLGLGHAIYQARKHIPKNHRYEINILLPDVIIDNFLDLSGIAFTDIKDDEKAKQYGLFKQISEFKFKLIEKPKRTPHPGSNCYAIGRYSVPEVIFESLRLKKYDFTEALNFLLENAVIFPKAAHCGSIYDCGTIKGYLEANAILSMEELRKL